MPGPLQAAVSLAAQVRPRGDTMRSVTRSADMPSSSSSSAIVPWYPMISPPWIDGPEVSLDEACRYPCGSSRSVPLERIPGCGNMGHGLCRGAMLPPTHRILSCSGISRAIAIRAAIWYVPRECSMRVWCAPGENKVGQSQLVHAVQTLHLGPLAAGPGRRRST